MGGIGFITANHAELARNNILINAHMLEASRVQNAGRFLFSSSACVYAQSKQRDTQVTSLKESDAFPADPEPGYGWEKLYAEQLCLYYRQDYKFETRIVRFHNVYGPLGTFDGGRRESFPLRFAAKWRWRATAGSSIYGAMESRRAPSCTWMIAWKDCCG